MCWSAAAGALFAGIMSRFPPRYGIAFLFFLAAIGAITVCSEALLQAAVFEKNLKSVISARDAKIEHRRVSEFYATAMKGKTRYWVPVEGGANGITMSDGRVVYPFSGEPNSVRVACKETGHWTLVQLDKYGFSENGSLWDAPVDIAIAGGSDIFGGCVDEPDRIATLLRVHYPKTLNLSVAGTGPGFRNAAIVEYGRLSNPKIVFWFMPESDFFLQEFESQFQFLNKYVEDDSYVQNITAYMREIYKETTFKEVKLGGEDLWPEIVSTVKDRFRDAVRFNQTRMWLVATIGWRKASPNGKMQYFANLPQERINEYVRYLNRSRRAVEGWGGRLVVVTYSTYMSQQAAANERAEYVKGFTHLKERLASENFEVINLALSMFEGEENRYAYEPPGMHINAAGHRALSGAVMSYIDAHKDALHVQRR